MHAIRSKARRTAWATDGELPNYNPFARTRSNDKRPADEEQALGRTRSETHLEPTIEEQRRAESRQAEKEFPSPQHADTAPPTSATTEKHPHSLVDGDQEISELVPGSPQGTDKKSAATSDTLVPGRKSGFRQRVKFRNILRKNEEGNEDDELARTETDKSGKSARQKAAFKRKIPIKSQVKAVLFGSWINLLLIAVPVGFVVNYLHINGVAIFVVNFIAIVPLAAMLSYATEEIALRVGETLGGLLNATFGNAVELIVSIQALVKNEITIVKTSLIGSMLSNLLLVLGMCFFFGGINRLEQYFNVTVAQTAASLLALCIGSLIIPTVFHSMLSSQSADTAATLNQELSRGTAVILLIVYACYLMFQLKTHVELYNAPSQKVPKRKSSKVEEGGALRGIAQIGAGTAAATGGGVNQAQLVRDLEQEAEDDEIDEPQLSILGALITLGLSTTMVAFCSEFMVDSISDVTASGTVSTTFVGLILLPIVGNAAEHATAVTVACKDKMDLAIGVAVGSSMQIALLVLPFVVVVGWIMGQDCMTLYFDTFQIAVLFVAVLLVNYLIQDGKSHWLEGVLLMATYLIIAVAGWFYPKQTADPLCPT